jgi:hypothetical protein
MVVQGINQDAPTAQAVGRFEVVFADAAIQPMQGTPTLVCKSQLFISLATSVSNR